MARGVVVVSRGWIPRAARRPTFYGAGPLSNGPPAANTMSVIGGATDKSQDTLTVQSMRGLSPRGMECVGGRNEMPADSAYFVSPVGAGHRCCRNCRVLHGRGANANMT